MKYLRPAEHYGPLGTAEEERERLRHAFAREDLLQERLDNAEAKLPPADEAVEQAARALYVNDCGEPGLYAPAWDDAPPHAQETYKRKARAALSSVGLIPQGDN